jgi:hypothetical protein
MVTLFEWISYDILEEAFAGILVAIGGEQDYFTT